MQRKWPFLKKKNGKRESLLPEVDTYYKSEHLEKTWLSWLLAAGTFIATVVIVLGLYYAGRWIYTQLTNSPGRNHTQTSQTNSTKQGTAPKSPSPKSNPTEPSNSVTTESSAVSTGKGSSTPSSSTLANTGPGNDTALFFVTVFASTALYQLIQRRRVEH